MTPNSEGDWIYFKLWVMLIKLEIVDIEGAKIMQKI